MLSMSLFIFTFRDVQQNEYESNMQYYDAQMWNYWSKKNIAMMAN